MEGLHLVGIVNACVNLLLVSGDGDSIKHCVLDCKGVDGDSTKHWALDCKGTDVGVDGSFTEWIY